MAAVTALPYAGLNLRRNPFSALPPDERTSVAVVEVEPLADLLHERIDAGSRLPPLAVQLVGPPGCGKTTWLRALRERFPDAPTVAWSAVRGWPPVPPGPLLFVDDAHLLPWRLRRRLRARRVLALATHRDLGGALRRRGYETRTVDVPSLATGGRLRRIVDRRIAHVRRAEGPVPDIPDADLEALLRRHGPDLRAVLDTLYDRIQALS